MKPLASVDLRVDYRHKLHVAVWSTKEAMIAHARKRKDTRTFGKETEAYFRSGRYRLGVNRTGRVVVRNNNVGEINLVINRFGAGVWAHELQHFLQWWFDTNCWSHRTKWEPMADLAGNLTLSFWNWFYKTFTPGERQP